MPNCSFAGLIWSFGPYVVRHIDDASLVQWQYLFYKRNSYFSFIKSLSIFEEGIDFYKNYLNIGMSGIIGGIGLGTAMMTFIYSITNTTLQLLYCV